MEFEREYRRPPPVKQRDDLWWQIALGIFVGQMMTGAVAGVLALMMGAYIANENEKATAPIVKQLERTVEEIRAPAAQRWHQRPHRPLSDGERCIKGERFRRLENGWAQVYNDPC
ncbi:chloride channel protein [Pseudoxanthomonas sp.]|uniref:chloride channel protein n=1 Tax=Pseudoxanthomonas sp. TaxID=1871049 RepID=UPI00260F5625|nr:chloride channel protein [Pseudoxanthomonas sp.]WDS36966.1 MAG: chloride channel protein [Pseudoxanthomonas sp.]